MQSLFLLFNGPPIDATNISSCKQFLSGESFCFKLSNCIGCFHICLKRTVAEASLQRLAMIIFFSSPSVVILKTPRGCFASIRLKLKC